ncbi:MAG TPA: cytosine permease [Candidatus Dormibacteraeota bacterium]|jgi:NCS1 family nucleobase:cation symporter-1|nr:cytosine permease [Candidatus Dormibacteraeota bacterium]
MATTVSPPGVSENDPPAQTTAFHGRRPRHDGHMVMETHGMAPIPEDQRYGGSWRNFTVWFAPNMELSGVFTGTLAFTLGLGFWPGVLAIVVGVILGALPVGLLATWGPKTGMGQLPLARLPFGKTIAVPAAVQWLTSVAWDALVGLFGAQAAQLLFHVPFFVGAIVVLALEGVIGFLGYEFIHQLEKWGSVILTVLFVVLSVRILQHGDIPTANTVHGGAAVGAFILMTTIAFSGSFSWASYAADYSRYQRKDTPSAPIFLWTLAGLSASFIWVYAIGLAGARVLIDQTAGGVQTLVGGGLVGILALLAVMFGAITGNALNDYSGSLAIQSAGVRIKRNWTAAFGTVLAFGLILWLNSGSLSSKFQNVLLFSAYWIAPFLAIILIDWNHRRGTVSRERLARLMSFRDLSLSWPALVALLVGFGAMVPFMNTGLVLGPVARALQGADLSFYVGFLVGGVVYWALRRFDARHRAAWGSA